MNFLKCNRLPYYLYLGSLNVDRVFGANVYLGFLISSYLLTNIQNMKPILLKTIYSLLLFSFVLPSIAQQTLESMYEGIEFDMPKVKETSFPDFEKKITEYDGVGDRIFKNTEAFKATIEAVNVKGGGMSIHI